MHDHPKAEKPGMTASEQLGVRVAALEHHSELQEIQRSLDETATRVRQQEQQFRLHRATMREIERQLDETEQRSIGVKQRASAVSKDLERLGSIVDSQERLAKTIEQSVVSAGLDRQVAALSRPPHSSREPPGSEGSLGSPGSGCGRQIWDALKELEHRLAREAERRAASQGEVLSVLGQGVQQLRSEQSRHATDMDDRFRLERRRMKQWNTEALARQSEHEKRADVLEARLDALAKALALERRAREEVAAVAESYEGGRGRSVPPAGLGARPGESRGDHLQQRLQQLEARVAEVGKDGEGSTISCADATQPSMRSMRLVHPDWQESAQRPPEVPSHRPVSHEPGAHHFGSDFLVRPGEHILVARPEVLLSMNRSSQEGLTASHRTIGSQEVLVNSHRTVSSQEGPALTHRSAGEAPGTLRVSSGQDVAHRPPPEAAGRRSASAGPAMVAGSKGTPWPSPVRPSTPSPAATPSKGGTAAELHWGVPPQLPMAGGQHMHIV